MRRFSCFVVALALMGTHANAADGLIRKAKKQPPTAAESPAVFTWTGCYVGGQVGAGWGHKDFSNPVGFSFPVGVSPGVPGAFSNHASGFLGGGEAGCKLQFAHDWVIGIDGDFAGTHFFSNQGLIGGPVLATFNSNTKWLASATANFGYSFDRLLLYAKGGAAWARGEYSFTGTNAGDPLFVEGNDNRSGWTVGGGLEYAFAKNFSAKIEYDYYNFGTKNVSFIDSVPASADIKQNINSVKLGLNYYFWNPVPFDEARASFAAASPPTMTWSQAFSSEVRYFSWKGTRGVPSNVVLPNTTPLTSSGSGSELYIPYATQLTGQAQDFKIEILGRGGWVRARQTTTGLTGEVATATDTVASGTFTYLGWKGFQPFASIAVNLPTGLASLPPGSVNARMDPDLVDVANFGEGLNIGPTLGFNLPLNDSFIVSLSAGYTHRGSYDRESTVTPPAPGGFAEIPSTIDPGNVFTVTGLVGFQYGQFTAKLTGMVSEETTTNQNGMPFIRPGIRYLGSGTFSYAWPQQNIGLTTLNVSASHSNRNEVLFLPPGSPAFFAIEPFNSNSNLYLVGLEHLFSFGQVAFGPTGSFLYRDANGYDPITLQFVPAKQRWAAGAQVKYAPNQTITFNARINRVWVRENENPALPGDEKFSVLTGGLGTAFTVPVLSSDGWQFAIGATASF